MPSPLVGEISHIKVAAAFAWKAAIHAQRALRVWDAPVASGRAPVAGSLLAVNPSIHQEVT